MTKISLGVAFAAGALACTPAFAASSVTDLFVASVKANTHFLDRSGKLASTHSRSPAVRAFAVDEIAAAVHTAALLDGVAPSTEVAEAGAGVMLTGRSVATAPARSQAANGRVAPGGTDLGDLAKLEGRRFDDALWLKQVDALSQLRADYETYAASGDDEVLRAMAKRELPKVEQRLRALTKI